MPEPDEQRPFPLDKLARTIREDKNMMDAAGNNMTPRFGVDRCGTCQKPTFDCTCAKDAKGAKFDNEKNKWELLPFAEVEDVVEVLTDGAKKYAPGNWQRVPNGKERYFSALMRHLAAWRKGERIDPDSGRTHLAHAACCLLFVMFLDKTIDKTDKI